MYSHIIDREVVILGHELIKERIVLEQKLGRNTTQVLLEGDIIVPDVKPDMSVILQSDARVCIDKFDASTDRVSFMGRLEISVLYLGRGSAKPVHSMSMVAPLDDFINIDGVTREMWTEAEGAEKLHQWLKKQKYL